MCKILLLFKNNLELKRMKWVRMLYSLRKSTGWSGFVSPIHICFPTYQPNGKKTPHTFFRSFSLMSKMAHSCYAAVPSVCLDPESSVILLCPSSNILLNVIVIKFVIYITNMIFYMENFCYMYDLKITCTFLLCN